MMTTYGTLNYRFSWDTTKSKSQEMKAGAPEHGLKNKGGDDGSRMSHGGINNYIYIKM